MNNILVTGAAGFIGYHLCKNLLDQGEYVTGLDNLNNYYDVNLKENRLKQLVEYPEFNFVKMNLHNQKEIKTLFEKGHFNKVVNLAAQAGVRYSLENPQAYIESNIIGFLNILEGCRHNGIEHLVFASSSSVYGANTKMPFSVHDNVDHPVSLYAASKKSNELMAHSYSHLFDMPCTGLRFFTVYGPWGRPDMALFLFTKAILENRPIDVFNHGRMKRDFTYIDDIVEGIVRVLHDIPTPNPKWSGDTPDSATSYKPYRLYNIGNNKPVELLRFIELIEDTLGKKAKKNMLPMQSGDVPATYADIEKLVQDTKFSPSTTLEDGIGHFVSWYRKYYKV